MKYFYCRVSTKEQNLDRQLEVAERFKPIEVICDKMSGKDFHRPEYERMKSLLKEGDEVYVKELDRLGRNLNLVKDELRWFDDHGIKFHSLDIPTTMIDYQGQEWIGRMVTNIIIEVLGSMAEQERIKIKGRQREGIDAMPVIDGKRKSKKTGRFTGRPEKWDSKKFLEIKRLNLPVEESCKMLGVSRSTWYNRGKAV